MKHTTNIKKYLKNITLLYYHNHHNSNKQTSLDTIHKTHIAQYTVHGTTTFLFHTRFYYCIISSTTVFKLNGIEKSTNDRIE